MSIFLFLIQIGINRIKIERASVTSTASHHHHSKLLISHSCVFVNEIIDKTALCQQTAVAVFTLET